jgi:RND family efflux transporter MFP subunit
MSFFKKHLKKIIIISIVLLVSGFGVYRANAKTKTSEIPKFDVKKDTVITPQKETIKDEITLAGSVDALLQSDLRFQTSGQLAWVGVKVGDKVKKYQAIASLNKDILKKQLQTDFNNYRSALATFDDTQDDYKTQKDNLTLTDDMKRLLVRSQNTLDNAVINYELQDLTLKYATLTSPINGVVVNIDQPANGVNVTPASASFYIIDPTSIYFKANIDQEDVTKIKVGDIATIKLDSFSDQTFDSKITYISFTPVTGESNTVYQVRFELPVKNEDQLYRLGMDGDVSISLKQVDNALTLPIEALHQENGQNYVLIKDNEKIIKKEIKTGIETDTKVEILEGITENDQVIITK